MSFSCVFFGAFWLDPGEGCESMRAAAPACSLARALRALAGGLSKERLGRLALLGNASEILPKTLPEAAQSSLWPSWGSFSPSWGSFGASLESFGASCGSFWTSWGSPGAPGALSGASGEPLGPSKNLPKSLPEALPEAPRTGA